MTPPRGGPAEANVAVPRMATADAPIKPTVGRVRRP